MVGFCWIGVVSATAFTAARDCFQVVVGYDSSHANLLKIGLCIFFGQFYAVSLREVKKLLCAAFAFAISSGVKFVMLFSPL